MYTILMIVLNYILFEIFEAEEWVRYPIYDAILFSAIAAAVLKQGDA